MRDGAPLDTFRALARITSDWDQTRWNHTPGHSTQTTIAERLPRNFCPRSQRLRTPNADRESEIRRSSNCNRARYRHMKCHRCSNPATLHITEIMQGVPHELHLCEECAQQYLSNPPSSTSGMTTPGGGIIKLPGSGDESQLDEMDKLVCPNCGITFREFRSQGRLGCPHDYIAFQDELYPLLENIHGEVQHCGKFPKRAPDDSRKQYQLIKLRNDLRSAIAEESYEHAAQLRDEIQALEGELKKQS